MRLSDGQGQCGYLSQAQEAALSVRLGERLMRDSKDLAAYIAAT